jgi:predicted HNH restriction endonuclease
VLLRDSFRCQVPGCGRAQHVEVHHLMPLGAGGSHVPEGLLVLCSDCHKNVHEGRLSIGGRAPDRLVIRRL